MKDLRITKGEVTIKTDFREPTVINESGQVIFTHNKACYDDTNEGHVYYSHNRMIADTNLIADTFNTSNKCGMLPSELLERYNEAVEALKGFYTGVLPMIDNYNVLRSTSVKKKVLKAEQVINKHKEG